MKQRTEAGQCVLGLRFSNDPFCFEQRFETLRQELGDRFLAVEIDSAPGNPYGHPKNAHSVLTHHLVDRPGTPTARRAGPDADLLPREPRGGERARTAARRGWATDRAGLSRPLRGSRGRRARPSARRRPSIRRTSAAVSVPAQCRRPTGSRMRRPYWVSTPVGKRPNEHPLVQRSSAQFSSSSSSGRAACAPNRDGQGPQEEVATLLLAHAPRGFWPAARRHRWRGRRKRGRAGWCPSVISASSSVATVAPLAPSARQNGSS